MSFGFGFGLPSWQTLSGGFTPASLFSAGEQGAWYDPTDVSISWRRNLLTYTEQFANAAWIKTNASITTNTTVAPDGTITADKLVEDTATAVHRAFQGIVTNAVQYTFSFYAKADNRNWAYVGFTTGASEYVYFDLLNGVVGNTDFRYTSASITNVGNGWYRCSVSRQASATTWYVEIGSASANGTSNYTGDGTSGIFIWGAQLEQASTASLYQQIVTPEITYLQTMQPSPVLFTDSAGITPVTGVEQFVGLMLDKSKGAPTTLGAELVTNGTFDTNTSGWTPGNSPVLTVGPNGVTIQNNGATNGILYQALTLVPGRTYRMEVTITYGGGFARLETSTAVPTSVGGANINVNASGRYQYFFTAVSATTYLVVGNRNDVNASNTYDNISVREIPGNHATSTGTKRPKLAARYNLLTYSEQFDNAVWGLGNATVTANATVAPNSTTTADTIVPTTTSGLHFAQQSVTRSTGSYSYSVYAKTAGYNFIGIQIKDLSGAFKNAQFNVSTGVVVSSSGAISTSITDVGNGWYRCVFTFDSGTGVGAPNDAIFVGSVPGNWNSGFSGDGTSGVYLWGADLRPTSQATGLIGPTYQRVAAATDYDTVGFLPYLAFDGVDDSMSTGSIDFTATDKMTVFAGVRKLSDAAYGTVVESSTNSDTANGSFAIFNPNTSIWNMRLKGDSTIGIIDTTTFVAPITNVLTLIGNLGAATFATKMSARVNGAANQAATSGTIGAGNFGNYPLFIGQRNGASLPFNGWMSSLIIRGAQSTDSQISATETWVNQRTGAY